MNTEIAVKQTIRILETIDSLASNPKNHEQRVNKLVRTAARRGLQILHATTETCAVPETFWHHERLRRITTIVFVPADKS